MSKDIILENRNQVDHNYKVGDKIILNKHVAYKYEMPYWGPFAITRCYTNSIVSLQYSPISIRHNIRQINPYKSDTNVEDINPENMYDEVNIW